MSGHVVALGSCWACGRSFTFNPNTVPSVPIDPVTNLPPDLGGDAERARREPLCRNCVERASAQRVARGDPPLRILPGAYDSMPEAELGE